MNGGIPINSNVAALRAQRRLADATSANGRCSERLSSGLRINHASDDAAGLLIGTSLLTDSRVAQQGVRNLNDAISLHSVAEGALESLSAIVTRIAELAEQSSNGTLARTQRLALDQEAQSLRGEYERIISTTEFNGLRLLDGSLPTISVQCGYGQSGSLNLELAGSPTMSAGGAVGNNVGNGTFAAPTEYSVTSYGEFPYLYDVNSDGKLDMVVGSDLGIGVALGNGDGSFQGGVVYQGTDSGTTDILMSDLNNDGKQDLVACSSSTDAVSVFLGRGDGTFDFGQGFLANSTTSIGLGDFNGDGKTDVVSANRNGFGVEVLTAQGDGTLNAPISTALDGSVNAQSLTTADFNSDGKLDIVVMPYGSNTYEVLLGNGDATFSPGSTGWAGNNNYRVIARDVNSDGRMDFVTQGGAAHQDLEVYLGHGDGTFDGVKSYDFGDNVIAFNMADINGDGVADALGNTGSSILVMYGQSDGSFTAPISSAQPKGGVGLAIGDVNGDGVNDVVTSEYNGTRAWVQIGGTIPGKKTLPSFSLLTESDARSALDLMCTELSRLGLAKGTLGSNQSRLAAAVTNTLQQSENYDRAASQIFDADIAEDSAGLVRNNILQQAAEYILAQANELPALALQLLQHG